MQGNIISGDELMVFVKDGQTYKSIAYATSHKLSVSVSTLDISSRQHDVFGSTEAYEAEWQITTENLYTEESYSTLHKYLVDMTPLYLVFGMPDNYTNEGTDDEWIQSSANGYKGIARLTSLQASASSGDVATLSATFLGISSLKKVDETPDTEPDTPSRASSSIWFDDDEILRAYEATHVYQLPVMNNSSGLPIRYVVGPNVAGRVVEDNGEQYLITTETGTVEVTALFDGNDDLESTSTSVIVHIGEDQSSDDWTPEEVTPEEDDTGAKINPILRFERDVVFIEQNEDYNIYDIEDLYNPYNLPVVYHCINAIIDIDQSNKLLEIDELGEYRIVADFAGDETYNPAVAGYWLYLIQKKDEPDQEQVVWNIDTSTQNVSTYFDETYTATIRPISITPSEFANDVKVYVNGTLLDSNSFVLDTAGTYTIRYVFEGNEYYDPSSTSYSIVYTQEARPKENVVWSIDTSSISVSTYNDETYSGTYRTISISPAALASDVKVYLDNTLLNSNSFTLSTEGTYTIRYVFEGNEYYNPSSTQYSIVYTQTQRQQYVTWGIDTSSLSVSSYVDETYTGTYKTISITPSSLASEVKVYLNNTLLNSNSFTLSTEGTYTIKYVFEGNAGYYPSSTQYNVVYTQESRPSFANDYSKEAFGIQLYNSNDASGIVYLELRTGNEYWEDFNYEYLYVYYTTDERANLSSTNYWNTKRIYRYDTQLVNNYMILPLTNINKGERLRIACHRRAISSINVSREFVCNGNIASLYMPGTYEDGIVDFNPYVTNDFVRNTIYSSVYTGVVRFDEMFCSNLYSSLLNIENNLVDASNLILPLGYDEYDSNTQYFYTFVYHEMFANCTKLKYAPIVEMSFARMFSGCTNLETVPTTLTYKDYTDNASGDSTIVSMLNYKYYGVFYNCSNITKTPYMDSTNAENKFNEYTFRGCSKLKYIMADAYNFKLNAGSYLKTDLPENGVFRNLNNSDSYDAEVLALLPNGWRVIKNYLTFEAIESGTFSFSLNDIQYSLDDGSTWTTLTAGSSTPTVQAGNHILWKASGLTPTSSNYGGIGTFSATGKFNVYGNILSLVGGDNFNSVSALSGTYQFASLFRNNTKLVSAENLILPSFTTNDCYIFFMSDCSNLTKAPKISHITLSTECFARTFQRTGLVTAPELPDYTGQTLPNRCYMYMFNSCTKLVNGPSSIRGIHVADRPCMSMFYLCSALLNAPKIIINSTNASAGFAPEMFIGCTSLNKIYCSINIAPSTTLTNNWLYNVASTGTFYIPNSITWDSNLTRSASTVPSGWTITHQNFS